MVDDYDASGDDYDSDPIAVERCAQRLDGGAMCGEPADLHCPICRVALCYSCAAEHCDQAAPMCRPPTTAPTAASVGRSLFGEHRDDA